MECNYTHIVRHLQSVASAETITVRHIFPFDYSKYKPRQLIIFFQIMVTAPVARTVNTVTAKTLSFQGNSSHPRGPQCGAHYRSCPCFPMDLSHFPWALVRRMILTRHRWICDLRHQEWARMHASIHIPQYCLECSKKTVPNTLLVNYPSSRT
jgi:hypothetical protein